MLKVKSVMLCTELKPPDPPVNPTYAFDPRIEVRLIPVLVLVYVLAVIVSVKVSVTV